MMLSKFSPFKTTGSIWPKLRTAFVSLCYVIVDRNHRSGALKLDASLILDDCMSCRSHIWLIENFQPLLDIQSFVFPVKALQNTSSIFVASGSSHFGEHPSQRCRHKHHHIIFLRYGRSKGNQGHRDGCRLLLPLETFWQSHRSGAGFYEFSLV